VLALSSNQIASTNEDLIEFQQGLLSICTQLSEDIVRNGEGTQHVIKVHVSGAPTFTFARDLGRFVVNSNLVKCAIAGCDPNVGRIVGASVGATVGDVGFSVGAVVGDVGDNVGERVGDNVGTRVGDANSIDNINVDK
jgi:glutamate N-acetyltransferase/amino-acid N-acetyltransferase